MPGVAQNGGADPGRDGQRQRHSVYILGSQTEGKMARPERFELPTAWFVARYSIQLSYGRVFGNCLGPRIMRRLGGGVNRIAQIMALRQGTAH